MRAQLFQNGMRVEAGSGKPATMFYIHMYCSVDHNLRILAFCFRIRKPLHGPLFRSSATFYMIKCSPFLRGTVPLNCNGWGGGIFYFIFVSLKGRFPSLP